MNDEKISANLLAFLVDNIRKYNFLWLSLFIGGIFRLINLTGVTYKDYDEGVYLYSAVLIMKGSVPYRDFFFNHLPLSEYLLALFFNVFGVGLLQARILTFFLSEMTIVIIYFLGKDLYGKLGGNISALLFAIEGSAIATSRIFFLEPFMTFFSSLTVFFFLRGIRNDDKRLIFISGIFLSFSTFSKITGVLLLVAIVAFSVFRQKFQKEFFIAFLCSVFLMCTPFLVICGNEFLIQPLLFQAYRTSSSGTLISNLKVLAFNSALTIFMGSIALGLSIIQRLIKNRPDSWQFKFDEGDLFIILWALILVTFFTTYKVFFYHYFYQAVPAFCFLIYKLVRRINFIQKVNSRIFLLIFILLNGIQLTLVVERNILPVDDTYLHVAQFIESTSQPHEKILTANPLLAFLSHRENVGNLTNPTGTLESENVKHDLEGKNFLEILEYLLIESRNISMVEKRLERPAQEKIARYLQEEDLKYVIIEDIARQYFSDFLIDEIHKVSQLIRIFDEANIEVYEVIH
ncbi:MAG: ArnT family glycosyltransferase [Promethearchaeota archaeon]